MASIIRQTFELVFQIALETPMFTIDEDHEKHWFIEFFIDKRIVDCKVEFLCRYSDRSDRRTYWEPIEFLQESHAEHIQQWEVRFGEE